MVTGIGKAPVLKHALETTSSEVGLHHPLRRINQAKSGQRRIQHLHGTVEDELTFDANFQFAASFLELPGVKTAMCRQAQVDAVVANQILRLLRLRSILEVGRGSDNGHAHVRRNTHGYHAACHLLAASNASVEVPCLPAAKSLRPRFFTRQHWCASPMRLKPQPPILPASSPFRIE